MFSQTTEFDHLMKTAFKIMFPDGSYGRRFKSEWNEGAYKKGVCPDFVLPDGRWIDFKLSVSFKESHNVAWRPSALYASLRKYIDHSSNPDKRLIIIYGKVFGSMKDVVFPICRGKKILIKDEIEFEKRIILIRADKAIERLRGTSHEWMLKKLGGL